MPHVWLPWKSPWTIQPPSPDPAAFQDIDEFVRKNAATCIREIARPAALGVSHGFLKRAPWVSRTGQPFGWFGTQNLGNLQSGPLECGWYGFSMIFSLFWKTRFSVCFGKWTLGKWMVWIFNLFWKTRLKPFVGSWTRFLRRDITTTRFLRRTCSLDLPQDSEAS